MTQSEAPSSLTIILVAYQSRADLARCLPTIFSQQTDFILDIIIIDNYGLDELSNWLSTSYPSIKLIANPVNDGYAGGNNLGLQHARGQYVLFLNPDTELWPGTLAQLMETARQHPNALITPKLLNPDGTINACGNQMQYTGITTCRGLNQPADTYTTCHAVPLLSGAALIGPTATFRRLGGFDITYFMYVEDTDLSLRARLLGFDLLCEARAVITHHYKLGMSDTKFYYLERNRLLTFLRVFSRPTLRQLLPALLLTELAMWGYSLRGWGYVRARLRTYQWLWQHRAMIRQQHQLIQQTRQRTDWSLLDGASDCLPIGQVASGRLVNWLGRAVTRLYSALRPRSLSRAVVYE